MRYGGKRIARRILSIADFHVYVIDHFIGIGSVKGGDIGGGILPVARVKRQGVAEICRWEVDRRINARIHRFVEVQRQGKTATADLVVSNGGERRYNSAIQGGASSVDDISTLADCGVVLRAVARRIG
ncbi:hypothetical protein EHLJMEHL_04966 [Vreelandella titanicae]